MSKLADTELIRKLNTSLPPIFARKEVKKLLGGAISSGTLANLAVTGDGPAYIKRGKTVLYERESFLNWFFSTTTTKKRN